MRILPWLQVIVNAATLGLVYGRLGNGELELPRAFGQAVLKSANAETMENPDAHPSILLTEASLHTLGSSVSEEPAQESVVDDNLKQVCEHTSVALSAQSATEPPNGRVYKECMASLAPLRDHQKDSDAVDTLSDCMALVNALVAAGAKGNSGMSLCSAEVVGTIQTISKTQPKLAPPSTVQPALKKISTSRPPPKELVADQAIDALELVAEAMTTVCTETVRDAEGGLKSELDAVKLAGGIAPICQDIAAKKLGSAAASQNLTHEWCHQLDGRLTEALETGFFFAFAPDEAQRQAKETNPYASTTRRKFCERFVTSLRHQAQDGSLYLGATHVSVAANNPPGVAKSLPAMPSSTPAPRASVPAPPPAAPKVVPQQSQVAPAPTTAPTQHIVSQPSAPLVSQQSVAAQAEGVAQAVKQEVPKSTQSSPLHSGVDMINLVQALSLRDEWNEACTGLLSRLTSEEGAVTEQYMLGQSETPNGAKVLTFNAVDQSQIRKCAAQLKVLAIQSGIPASTSPKKAGLVSTGVVVGSSLEAAEDAETIMESPWAADACNDIAHGFLTAHLAHPGLRVQDFCPLYARDLQAMRTKPTEQQIAERSNQEMQMLRKRGVKDSIKRREASSSSKNEAVVAKQANLRAPPTTVKHASAALITPKQASVDAKDEEQEGMDFWRDMLQ